MERTAEGHLRGVQAQADRSELDLVSALRAGDEAAFQELVRRHGATMLRLAELSVGSRAVAEEVVQEAWLGVLQGVDRFQGRSSLKTWIFRILLNKAYTRAAKESGSVPFSALGGADPAASEPAVDPDRFFGPERRSAGRWVSNPPRFTDLPEERLLAAETRASISAALASLPPAQRTVVALRDVAGWSSEEVCEVLGLSVSNQRVLLHRGRSKVRAALERHLTDE